MSSLSKFVTETKDGGGKPLYWHRAEEDGLPFRGPSGLYKTEDEYDARVSRICDFKAKKFSIEDPKEFAEYCNIMDHYVNKWFTIFFRDPHPELGWIYLEWGEYFMEDATAGRKPVGAPPPVAMIQGNGHGDAQF